MFPLCPPSSLPGHEPHKTAEAPSDWPLPTRGTPEDAGKKDLVQPSFTSDHETWQTAIHKATGNTMGHIPDLASEQMQNKVSITPLYKAGGLQWHKDPNSTPPPRPWPPRMEEEPMSAPEQAQTPEGQEEDGGLQTPVANRQSQRCTIQSPQSPPPLRISPTAPETRTANKGVPPELPTRDHTHDQPEERVHGDERADRSQHTPPQASQRNPTTALAPHKEQAKATNETTREHQGIRSHL